MHGFSIAFWEITTLKPLLENFTFKTIPVSLGQIAYIEQFAEPNLLALQGKYGIAMAGFDAGSAFELIYLF